MRETGNILIKKTNYSGNAGLMGLQVFFACMKMSKFLLSQNLNLIQPGKGRFTLTCMSHDYRHAEHTGLPSWIRVKSLFYDEGREECV